MNLLEGIIAARRFGKERENEDQMEFNEGWMNWPKMSLGGEFFDKRMLKIDGQNNAKWRRRID